MDIEQRQTLAKALNLFLDPAIVTTKSDVDLPPTIRAEPAPEKYTKSGDILLDDNDPHRLMMGESLRRFARYQRFEEDMQALGVFEYAPDFVMEQYTCGPLSVVEPHRMVLRLKEGVSYEQALDTILNAAQDRMDQKYAEQNAVLADVAERTGTTLSPIHNVGRVVNLAQEKLHV